MNFIEHPDTNYRLGAPPGWDDTNPGLPCDTLPVVRTYHQDGLKSHPVVNSYWLPTQEEFAILVNGGAICLSIMGLSMPPVMLGVEHVPTDR